MVEIAWALRKMDTGQTYAELRHVLPKDIKEAKKNAHFCHGINIVRLNQMELCREETVWREVETVAKAQTDLLIVSADESETSDVFRKVESWGIPYHNVPLPRWETRTACHAHKVAQQLKLAKVVEFAGAVCPYRDLHSMQIYSNKKSAQSGAHCALVDVCELLAHIDDKQLRYALWKVLQYEMRRLSDQSSRPPMMV